MPLKKPHFCRATLLCKVLKLWKFALDFLSNQGVCKTERNNWECPPKPKKVCFIWSMAPPAKSFVCTLYSAKLVHKYSPLLIIRTFKSLWVTAIKVQWRLKLAPPSQLGLIANPLGFPWVESPRGREGERERAAEMMQQSRLMIMVMRATKVLANILSPFSLLFLVGSPSLPSGLWRKGLILCHIREVRRLRKFPRVAQLDW